MLDIGDPAFKLFGKTIPLLNSDEASGDSGKADLSSEQMSEETRDSDKEQAEEKSTHESDCLGEEHDADSPTASKKDTSEDQNSVTSINENSEGEAQKDEEKEQDGQEAKNSSEKTLKKPDKILPCPRCKSMDTKFCYYNNYNVNQPRHFCKSCQRYWTAGGTMRNVPVGAGRRKNKSSPSKYCHMSISDAGIDLPHTQPETGLKRNGAVLSFGVDPSLCDSMASMMNLVDNKVVNGNDRSSTVSTSSSTEGHQIPQKMSAFNSHQVPCFPGFQLAYGWTPTVPLAPPPPPGFFPPMPFYPPPPPYWNGAAIPWNMPIVSVIPKSTGSNPNSPTLGKHSRDEGKSDKSSQVLVPKTLRIDDPEEAAKSSIWTTLGIKKVEPAENGGFFKGLQSKSENKSHKIESFPVLTANPAALARSISYQETV